MAGYILSSFLIGGAYRLFRELMPGRNFSFLLSGSAAYAGTPPAEDPKGEMLLVAGMHARQVTVQLRGIGMEMEK